jgi:hypothetical protein
LYDLICKYSEFEEIIEYLSINNIFFWLEFITGLPSRSLQEERTFYTLEFKDFITTRTRKTLIKKLIKHIESGVPLLVQKTTGLGATTSIISVALWYLFFRPHTRIVIVCPSLSGNRFSSTARKLFEYIQMFLQLCNYCSCEMRHHNEIFRFYTVDNIHSGSSIVLLPSNKPLNLAQLFSAEDKIQNKVVIFDEMAFHKEADNLWHSLDGTGVNRIAVSSANSRSNLFYELVNRGNIPLHTMHWFHEPECDKKWYKKICSENDPAWVEQYININYRFKYSKPLLLKAVSKTEEQKQVIEIACEQESEIQTKSETLILPAKNHVKRTRKHQKDPGTRKQHRNPYVLKEPSDYNTALLKYVTTASRKKDPVSEKTAKAIRAYKDKLSAKEPRMVESMSLVMGLVERIKKMENQKSSLKDLRADLDIDIMESLSLSAKLLIPESIKSFVSWLMKKLPA